MLFRLFGATARSLGLIAGMGFSAWAADAADVTGFLPDVVVTASRIEQERSSARVVVDVIDRDQIDQSGASNLAEFLDTVAGVNLSRLYGRSGVDASLDIGYMGESGAQNVLVLVDGQRLNAMDQSSVLFSQIPLGSVRRIEIRKANGGSLYGDRAQGGVVNIITREDDARQSSLSLGSFGSRKLDAYVGMQADGLKASLGWMSARSDGYRQHSASQQESVQIKLSTADDWGRLGVSALLFAEKAQLPSYLTTGQFLENPRAVGAFPLISDRTGGSAGLRYDRVFGEGSAFSLDLSHRSSEDTSYSTIHHRRTVVTPEMRSRTSAWEWMLGAEWSLAAADTTSGKQVARRSDSIYGQINKPLGQQLSLEASARVEQVGNEFQVSPLLAGSTSSARQSAVSLAGRYAIAQNTTLRLAALSGFRFPNADELYYFDRSSYELLTINPTVKPMQSQEWTFQMVHAVGSGQLDLHYRRIGSKDEIGYRYDCGTVDGSAASCNTNLYDSRREVLSLGARWQLSSSFSVRGTLDLVQARINSGLDLGQRIPLTPRQAARFSGSYVVHGYTLMAAASYRSEMVQASDPSATYPKIPGRTVVDLGVSKMLSGRWTMSAWLRNAFDKRYYDFAQFDGLYPADGRGLFLTLKASL